MDRDAGLRGPVAGLLAGRIGGRPILVAGMVLLSAGLAWIAAVTTPTVEYLLLVPGFVFAGIGMGLFFAPIANVVLSAVEPIEEGQASGASNTIREIGGVFGVAVLASVFSRPGLSPRRPSSWTDSCRPCGSGRRSSPWAPSWRSRCRAASAARRRSPVRWPRRRPHPRV